ncbi:hypothetical protein PMIN03_001638 [Paraphaeosphaeria minitans]|uniref:Uncharacterized protein n=1 Tax=Paraphaeosphaeria minitans TaxID=565426 RepID=A0A9P6KP47_9PLEO|nr:hypothetical protein PMIN01_07988 [Paraphaeosphaeria minitans]
MKSAQFAVILVGILFTLGRAFNFFPQFGHHNNDVMQVDSGAVSTLESVDVQQLEARRSRGSRTSRKKPARPVRKRPAKKKTTTKKKSSKKTTKKKGTKKTTKKPTTGTKKCTVAMKKTGKCKAAAKCTAAMKKAGKCKTATKCTAAMKKAGKCPAIPTKSHAPTSTSAAACKYSPKPKAGTAGAKGGNVSKKLQARIDPDPCRPADENDKIMIDNFKIAQRAAKKKGETLKDKQMYLFLVKQGPTVGAKHHAVVVGKVMKVGNQLGMEATMQQLGKPTDQNGNAVRHPNAKVFCGSAVGGVCNTGPYRRIECGRMSGKYKFISGASVDFADPEHFIQKGEEVFMAEKPYNVLTWNCQVYAKKLINVTKLKPGQIVELTNEQAKPSRPQGTWSDSDSDWDDEDGMFNGGLGGFRVVNANPEPFNENTNNGDRFEID